jgi:hypothetical protein
MRVGVEEGKDEFKMTSGADGCCVPFTAARAALSSVSVSEVPLCVSVLKSMQPATPSIFRMAGGYR